MASARMTYVLPIKVASGDITYAFANAGAYNNARMALDIRVVFLG